MNIRFDWSPHTSTFTVRILSPIHEEMKQAVVTEVTSQLAHSADKHKKKNKKHKKENKIVSKFDHLIRDKGSPRITLKGFDPIEGTYPSHEPDGSFAYTRTQYPSLVIEISYPQKRKDLSKLADDYICGSNGEIKVVVGLDLEYSNKSKKATTSIWRPQITPDPENEADAILETKEIRKDDVSSAFLFSFKGSL